MWSGPSLTRQDRDLADTVEARRGQRSRAALPAPTPGEELLVIAGV